MPTQEVRRDSNLLVYASLAQSVEHAAVNRGVVGSSPTRGARKELALTKVGAKLKLWAFSSVG